jgi:hypothetical protein
MPSPFPGMDPYLETPELWPDVHHEIISQIRNNLHPALLPNYVARVALRVYVSDQEPGLIDDIEEARLEIRDVDSKSLVSVIEVLSPRNKIPQSRGHLRFMEQRQEILDGPVHWVEIDLLRDGYVPTATSPPLNPSDYRVLVSRAERRAKARYAPLSLRQPLPVFWIPLRGAEPDVPLDLGAVLRAAYDAGAYNISIDYSKEPDPPLNPHDAKWAYDLLRKHFRRHR